MQCKSSPSHWPFFVALPRNHLREERLVCRTFGAGHMIGFPALRAWELFSGVPHDCYFQSPYGALHPPSKSGARSPAQVGFQVSKIFVTLLHHRRTYLLLWLSPSRCKEFLDLFFRDPIGLLVAAIPR